jgi:uncharacterized protein with NRDE domain
MCLIALAWGANERFPFAIAANRDEFLARPTAPLSQWTSPGGATVVGGRDLQDGGTWMGFSHSGRLAMLTNVRNPQAKPPDQAISRGSLAVAWLESDLAAPAWALQLDPTRYQGFNLIVGDWPTKQCHYITNSQQDASSTSKIKAFEPLARIQPAVHATDLIVLQMAWGQIYGLSNASLDTAWPKTQLLKQKLQSSLELAQRDELMQVNLQNLALRSPAADAFLPATGVSIELERALSSIFVSHPAKDPHYGTRTSLVAAYQPGGGLKITETTHAQQSRAANSVHAQLDWR